jgi:hypothetical protein
VPAGTNNLYRSAHSLGLVVFYNKVGNVQASQDNLPAALTSFQAGFAIADRLAKSAPGNAGWQHDLAGSYVFLALAYRAAAQPAKSREALAAGRAIIAPLAAQFPDQAQWKQQLTWFDQQIAALKN